MKTIKPKKEELYEFYVKQKLTQKQIAIKLKICVGKIIQYMKEYEIKARSRKENLSGKIKSEEHKRKLSDSKKGNKNPNFGKKRKILGKRVWYLCPNGEIVSMRSSWESAYAEFLDNKKIKWNYEPKTFILKSGKAYTPDFYLQDTNEWIEVKGWFTETHKKIISDWIKDFPNEKISIADKNYLTNLGINLKKIWFTSKPQFDCAECGNKFYKKDSNQKLCSIKCRNKFVAKNRLKKKEFLKSEKNTQKRKYNGNQRGEKNNGSKFSEEDVKKIKQMRENGVTYKEISEKTKMSSANIWNVCSGKSWI